MKSPVIKLTIMANMDTGNRLAAHVKVWNHMQISYVCTTVFFPWRHQMETFSALLAICAGNSPVPGAFPPQRPVTRSFDVSFDLHPHKRLSKQWWGWWYETLSCPLWHGNALNIFVRDNLSDHQIILHAPMLHIVNNSCQYAARLQTSTVRISLAGRIGWISRTPKVVA